MKIHTRALLTMQIAAMISGQRHQSGLKSTSADGSSNATALPSHSQFIHRHFLNSLVRMCKMVG